MALSPYNVTRATATTKTVPTTMPSAPNVIQRPRRVSGRAGRLAATSGFERARWGPDFGPREPDRDAKATPEGRPKRCDISGTDLVEVLFQSDYIIEAGSCR